MHEFEVELNSFEVENEPLLPMKHASSMHEGVASLAKSKNNPHPALHGVQQLVNIAANCNTDYNNPSLGLDDSMEMVERGHDEVIMMQRIMPTDYSKQHQFDAIEIHDNKDL